MKKILLIIIAIFTLSLTIITPEVKSSAVIFKVSKIRFEPMDAIISMLGTLEMDKIRKKQKNGDAPKGGD